MSLYPLTQTHTSWLDNLDKNPTAECISRPKKKKKQNSQADTAETNDLQMRPAQNKTLLNFYYLSTTLCTDTESENEEDRRSADDNETPKTPNPKSPSDSLPVANRAEIPDPTEYFFCKIMQYYVIIQTINKWEGL